MPLPVSEHLLDTFTSFTNTVLLAMLPQISDFCKNAELPVPAQLTTNHVKYYYFYPGFQFIEAEITLTNNFSFLFRDGVKIFRAPGHNGLDLSLRSPSPGNSRRAQSEAVELGRSFIRKLGYAEKDLYVNLEPEVRVDKPTQLYHLRWVRPHAGWEPSVTMTIHLPSKRLMRVMFTNGSAYHPLALQIPPELRPARPVPENKDSGEKLNETETAELLKRLQPVLDEFSATLRLPMSPADLNAVKEVHCAKFKGVPKGVIFLQNGYKFWFKGNEFGGVLAPEKDIFFIAAKEVDLDDFQGTPRYSERQAIKLVKQTVAKLGHKPAELGLNSKPEVFRPAAVKPPMQIPRIAFMWVEDRRLKLECEMDTSNGEFKQFSVASIINDRDFAALE